MRKRALIFCMMLAAAFIAGCGKKKEEAQQAALVQPAKPPESAYDIRLKDLAKKAAEEVEASGADKAKTARAAELVHKLEIFDYSGSAYQPEETPQEPGSPYFTPNVHQPAPVKDELSAIMRELGEIGRPAVPALMERYCSIPDIEPRRQMLAAFRLIPAGMDLIMPFLLEALENDPYEDLRLAAGMTLHSIVIGQGDKAGEFAAFTVPQLVEIALRTKNSEAYEPALSDVYESQIRGYALSSDLMEKLRKGLAAEGYNDLRGILIARCLLAQGDEAGKAFLLGSLQAPTDWDEACWTLHLLGEKRVGEAAGTAGKLLRDKDHAEVRAEAAWTLGRFVIDFAARKAHLEKVFGKYFSPEDLEEFDKDKIKFSLEGTEQAVTTSFPTVELYKRALQALSDALVVETEPEVYREIALALARSGDDVAAQLLLDQSQANEQVALRIQCISALAEAVETGTVAGGLADKVITNFLEQALRDAEPSMRARYISALAAASGKAAEDLRGKIVAECVNLMHNDPQFAVRAEAAAALPRFPDKPVMNDLLEALREEKAQYVKINIIHALAERRSSEAIRPLVDMLKTDNREIVSACAEALPRMEGFSPDILFNEYLSGGVSSAEKKNILLCLRQLKDEDGKIAQFLLERALPAETDDARRRDIIGDIGQRIPPDSPLEKKVVDALLDILKNSADTETLRAAIDALGTYKDEATIEPIIAAAKKNPDVDTRLETVRALERIGKAREDVIQFFLEIAAGVNFENYKQYGDQVRGVAEALTSLDRAEVSRLIRERCLNEKDPKIRRAALMLSFVIDDLMFDAYLMSAAKNAEEPPDVRSGAILGLGMRGSRASVPMLVNMLSEEKGDIAESAAYALGAIGDMKAFRPLLDTIRSLRNGPPQKAALKDVAVFALRLMTGQDFGDDTAKWEKWQTMKAAASGGGG